MLGNTSPATPAMLATQRLSDHAEDTEILFVEFPRFKKFGNDRPLLVPTAKFGDITRVFDHRDDVEVSCRYEEERKEHV